MFAEVCFEPRPKHVGPFCLDSSQLVKTLLLLRPSLTGTNPGDHAPRVSAKSSAKVQFLLIQKGS